MEIISLSETGSTNSYIAAQLPDAPHGTVVTTRAQTAGRGQRGNSWEAEPGMNVTMSVVVRPRDIMAAEQFVISQAAALAAVGVIDAALAPVGLTAAVKWPNDIYVGDMKLSGTLIECTLSGRMIDRCIIGIGVNVNQQVFTSDAPNPVSLRQLTGRDLDVGALTVDLAAAIIREVEAADSDVTAREDIRQRYRRALWRGTGIHRWRDTATGDTFDASVSHIEPSGHLVMTDGRRFAFKDVAPILDNFILTN